MTGRAKVVRLGSAAAKRARAAAPDSTNGPNSVCLAYFHYSTSVGSGASIAEDITFSSSPFVVGSMFNETTQQAYAEESEYQSGVHVDVTVLNNGGSTETIAGYFGVLYNPISGGC